jgi:hypothetical protein
MAQARVLGQRHCQHLEQDTIDVVLRGYCSVRPNGFAPGLN